MRDIRSIGRYHHHASFRLPFRRDSASPPSFRSSTLSVVLLHLFKEWTGYKEVIREVSLLSVVC